MIQTIIYTSNKVKKNINEAGYICNCQVEISWDDTQPVSGRTHNLKQYLVKCSYHQLHFQSDAAGFQDILRGNDQNGTWNIITSFNWEPNHDPNCNCKLSFLKDLIADSAGIDDTQAILTSETKQCAIHANIIGVQKHYDVVLEENKRRKFTLIKIQETLPGLVETITDSNGNQITQFKQGLEPQFVFNVKRELEVTIPNASKKDKKDAAKALANFDPILAGKVVIK